MSKVRVSLSGGYMGTESTSRLFRFPLTLERREGTDADILVGGVGFFLPILIFSDVRETSTI